MDSYFVSISEWDYSLLAALLLVFALQVYFYVRYMAAVARAMGRKGRRMSSSDSTTQPNAPKDCREGVSIIVCARNEACNLEPYLQALLTQDYPEFEVIIVNDASEDSTQEVIDRYMAQYPNVRTTFVPYGARVGSTKKLALTLGAKAARYDYLLLTDADCRPESTHWISEMMQGFCSQETEIVLGYGAYFKEKGALNRLIRYDTLFNGLHYLGAALCGHPYMGVGRNLAYRKSLFFESGGFSHLMTSCAGDDDLFVNHVATARNTAVVLSTDSITWSITENSWRGWFRQKRRHLSVSPQYKLSTKMRLSVEPVSRGLFYLLLILAGVFGSPLLWIIGGALFLVRLIMQVIIIDISAVYLKQSLFGIEVLWYDICLPIISAYMLLTQPLRKKVNW